MAHLTILGDTPISLYYTDSGGEGRPVVLIHGWPLSGEAFAGNEPALVAAGHRVITYDRRGFGRSDKPPTGYDYDTLASDLNELMLALDLTDAVLLGFSMGGGEVARYLGTYGEGRVAGAVFVGSITPALAKSDDNPDGAMGMVDFFALRDQCAGDRDAFLEQFTTWFYSNNEGLTVDESVRREAVAIGGQGSDYALPATIVIWATDFRADLATVTVPTLVIHGDGDQNVPFAASGARMQQFVPHAQLHVVAGGPHGLNVSHREEFDKALGDFLASL